MEQVPLSSGNYHRAVYLMNRGVCLRLCCLPGMKKQQRQQRQYVAVVERRKQLLQQQQELIVVVVELLQKLLVVAEVAYCDDHSGHLAVNGQEEGYCLDAIETVVAGLLPTYR